MVSWNQNGENAKSITQVEFETDVLPLSKAVGTGTAVFERKMSG